MSFAWPDDLLTQKQAAQRLGVCQMTLYRLRPENNNSLNPSLEYTRLAGRIWYSKADLANYIRKCKNRVRRAAKKSTDCQPNAQG